MSSCWTFRGGARTCVSTPLWILAALVMLTGCNRETTEASPLQVQVAVEPDPPAVGDARVTVQVTREDGTAVEGADVRVEGNMNHAGMKPSFAELEEGEPGEYAGTLDFTMGGDWYLMVTVVTPDGASMEHKHDVRGVVAQ